MPLGETRVESRQCMGDRVKLFLNAEFEGVGKHVVKKLRYGRRPVIKPVRRVVQLR